MVREELMVGDWVMFNNVVDKVQEIYGKVGNAYLQKYGTIEISRLSPIPLTTKILKKNGFNETSWGGEWTNDNVDFILIEHNDGFRMIDTNIVLLGVHHFQHALRLCNIDKEIEI